MKENTCREAGAAITRGEIAEVTAGGYRVDSLDLYGLRSSEITGIDDTAYSAGDLVYYFAFPDGTGKILCKIQ